MPLDDELRRFVLTSIPSVPYLEALLLLHRAPGSRWRSEAVAARLYLGEKAAAGILAELCSAGLIECDGDPPEYRFTLQPGEAARLVERLALAYALNLVEVTHLIHSRDQRGAQRFADAFKLRKDS